jgi:transcriptional regulator with XRE-family HTH domain
MTTDEKFIKAFGRNLDKIRQQRGMTYRDLAADCKMDYAQIFRICTEGKNITITTIKKLSEGLEIPVSELFDF